MGVAATKERQRARDAVIQRVGDGTLESGADIVDVRIGQRLQRGGELAYRRLQAREGEIEPLLALQWARQLALPRLAAFSTSGPPG